MRHLATLQLRHQNRQSLIRNVSAMRAGPAWPTLVINWSRPATRSNAPPRRRDPASQTFRAHFLPRIERRGPRAGDGQAAALSTPQSAMLLRKKGNSRAERVERYRGSPHSFLAILERPANHDIAHAQPSPAASATGQAFGPDLVERRPRPRVHLPVKRGARFSTK